MYFCILITTFLASQVVLITLRITDKAKPRTSVILHTYVNVFSSGSCRLDRWFRL
jgi:hypothetical protein